MERNPEEYSYREMITVFKGRAYQNADQTIDKEFIRWKRDADQGSVVAQVMVANAYREGTLVGESEEMAFKYFSLAAEQGDKEAQFQVGEHYLKREGQKRAYPYHMRAALQGHPDALSRIADCYYDGILTDWEFCDGGDVRALEKEHALEHYHDAAEKGSVLAMSKLSTIYGGEDNPCDGLLTDFELRLTQNSLKKYDIKGVFKHRSHTGEKNPTLAKSKYVAIGQRPFVAGKSDTASFKYAEMAAGFGHLDGLRRVASCYREGRGCKQSHARAFKYEKKAADQSRTKAACQTVGDAYLMGIGVKPSHEMAFKYYKMGGCLLRLGHCYMLGMGVEESESKAFEYYNRAKSLSTPEAEYWVGLCYLHGIGVDMDLWEALKHFIRAYKLNPNKRFRKCILEAEKGLKDSSSPKDAQAQYRLGLFYLGECELRESLHLANEHMCLAVDQGHSGALCRRGAYLLIYYKNEEERARGVAYIKQAAEQGCDEAMFYLSRMYKAGDLVEKSLSKAVELCKEAARLGNKEAIYLLGQHYFLGQGVQQSDGEALKCTRMLLPVDWVTDGSYYFIPKYFKSNWDIKKSYIYLNLEDCYRKGKGVEPSQALLYNYFHSRMRDCPTRLRDLFEKAKAYQEGKGVERSDEIAFEMFKRAADTISANENLVRAKAAFEVANCYRWGIGVEPSYEAAFTYYQKSGSSYGFALYELGDFYRYGIGVDQSEETATNCYEQASKKGAKRLENPLYAPASLEEEQKLYQLEQRAKVMKDGDIYLKLAEIFRSGKYRLQSDEKAFHYYQKSVDCGSAKGLMEIAECYTKGRGTKQSNANAVKTWARAASHNIAEAFFELGRCYLEGRGVLTSVDKAIKLFKKGANLSSAPACYALFQIFEEGLGGQCSSEQAYEYCRKAADLGDTRAMVDLGNYYLNQDDDQSGLEYFKAAADQGDANALYLLGEANLFGRGNDPSDAKAFTYYKLAADEKNHADAQLQLGHCYRFGRGTAPSDEKAFEYYRKSADQGIAEAQFAVAECYKDGVGVVPSPVLAFFYMEMAKDQSFEKALQIENTPPEKIELPKEVWQRSTYFTVAYHRFLAEQKNTEAMLHLARCYENGDGVEQSDEKAFYQYFCAAGANSMESMREMAKWYRGGRWGSPSQSLAFCCLEGAAGLGCPKSCFEVGTCYLEGVGVEQSEKMAFEYFLKGAKLGDTQAQAALARCYWGGLGVNQSYAEGLRYFQKATKMNGSDRPKFSKNPWELTFFDLEYYIAWLSDFSNQLVAVMGYLGRDEDKEQFLVIRNTLEDYRDPHWATHAGLRVVDLLLYFKKWNVEKIYECWKNLNQAFACVSIPQGYLPYIESCGYPREAAEREKEEAFEWSRYFHYEMLEGPWEAYSEEEGLKRLNKGAVWMDRTILKNLTWFCQLMKLVDLVEGKAFCLEGIGEGDKRRSAA